MLHEFLTSNREELIDRCREKAAHRLSTTSLSPSVGNDAPLFLVQLVDTLRCEESGAPPRNADLQSPPAPTEIGRAAALHGSDMLRKGYTVDLLVHHYGDICQAITELAIDRSEPISTNEFRILNRSLDNAIAEAVTAYGKDRQVSINDQADAVGEHLDHFSSAQQALLETAIQTFIALQTGKLGLTGTTAMAHLHSLNALRALTNQSVSAVRLASAKSTVAPARRGRPE